MGTNIRTKKFPVSWDEVPIVIDLEYVSCYILQYTTQRLRQLAVLGKFPAFKVETFWRVDKEDLRKWIEQRKQKTDG